jgi:cytochrome c-type biogenesis protein CcmH/NrfG
MADRAHAINPLTARPLLVKAAVEASDERDRDALLTLERAVRDYPADPQVWLRLASFQLRALHRPEDALQTLRGALYLDPKSRAVQALFFDARASQRERATPSLEPAPAP